MEWTFSTRELRTERRIVRVERDGRGGDDGIYTESEGFEDGHFVW